MTTTATATTAQAPNNRRPSESVCIPKSGDYRMRHEFQKRGAKFKRKSSEINRMVDQLEIIVQVMRLRQAKIVENPGSAKSGWHRPPAADTAFTSQSTSRCDHLYADVEYPQRCRFLLYTKLNFNHKLS